MNNSKNLPVILIVDDELHVLEALETVLYKKFRVLTAKSGNEALEKIFKESIDIVFLDIKLPDIDGMQILRRIKEYDKNIPVVMATAIDSVRTAVEAMQSGAYSYITKPFDADEVITVCQNALESRRLLKELIYFRSQRKEIKVDNIIGKNKQMDEIYTIIRKVAKNDATILISGESGTGKELIARAIHCNSLRKQKPFIAIDCASIPETLLESELFGHEKGAFTDATTQKLGMLELANEGTLFLDEISDLKLSIQAKLLRVLEEKEIKRLGGTKIIKIDVRIVSATNSNLKKAIQEGKFRDDLYYRLNVVPINLPPLRERKNDIPLLVNHFIKIYNHAFKKSIQGYENEALEYLMDYNWPGNIRELKNIIERLVALKDGGCITAKDLPFDIFIKSNVTKKFRIEGRLKDASNNFQRQYIEAVLERVGGNRIHAAKILGIHRNALFNKIKAFGVKNEN